MARCNQRRIRIHDVMLLPITIMGLLMRKIVERHSVNRLCTILEMQLLLRIMARLSNSPNYRYRLTDEMLKLIQSFGTDWWETKLASFQTNHGTRLFSYMLLSVSDAKCQ